MTYTEDDLRATFEALEREAPDVAGTLAGLERLRRRHVTRRRAAGIAAVAVVTMALAAGSLAVPDLFGTDTREQVSTKRDADAWRYRFAVDDIPGTRVAYTGLSRGQEAAVVVTGMPARLVATILVFRRDVQGDAFDPAEARTGERVDIGGRPGYYRPDLPTGSMPPPKPGLAWEYAPGSWAVVTSAAPATPNAKAELLRIAEAVRFDRAAPFRVPFRVGHLPARFGVEPRSGQLGSLGSRQPEGQTTPNWWPTDGTRMVGVDLSEPGSNGRWLSIELQSTSPTSGLVEPTDVGDTRNLAKVSATVSVTLGPLKVFVRSGGMDQPGFSEQELLEVARSITVAADWNDPATWIDAQEAIPTR
jgi:hypothetical protein